MLPKDLATVRVSNLSPNLKKKEIHNFLDRRNVNATSNISLCPHGSAKDSSLVATVTFHSQSSAKRALDLNGRVLAGRNVSIERDFMGLTVLAAPTDPELDIIAVHGLNGHAYGTWAHHEDAQPGFEAMWLRDFLPYSIQKARIMVYGYNSTLLGSKTSVSNIKDFAQDLLQRIIDDRVDQRKPRPLVFICHSLGGIVVKQALVSAHANPERYHTIEAATRSILFLATPHGGSKSANIGLLMSHVASLAFQSPSIQLLETLKHDSDILSQLSHEFRQIHSSFDIVNFYERRKTPGLNSLVVDETSSKLGVENEILIPIDATHRRICKFQSPTDPLFLPLLAQIKRCSAPSTQIDEILVGTDSTPTIVPRHFIVPVSPNPQFVGRTEQLQLLDDYLSAQDHDTCSTYPIVAIHGLGGVGKTQLATKFVYDRKSRKPSASVFWVSARNADEIATRFQEIADKMLLVRKADGGIGYSTAEPAAGVRTHSDGVDLLKSWMLTPGHEDWLLVLDNFDDIQVKIDHFLPIGASGSVLITSRDRNVIGSVATSGFALTAMDVLDAERLFVRIQSLGAESSPRRPSSDPERQDLKQILEELQYFPLAIDQAASFIRENSPMTLREYLTYLKPRSVDRERLLRFKQANPTYPDSVMTTWEISLRYLERTQPRAGWMLQLLGFLDHSYISEELLTAATKRIPWMFDAALIGKKLPLKYQTQMAFLKDDVGFRVAIGTLVSLSLIQRHLSYLSYLSDMSDMPDMPDIPDMPDMPDLSGATLHVHPLVHEWIRVRLNPYPEQQAKFSVIASLILYQHLPTELFIWLDYDPPSNSEEISRRIKQVSHHIRGVLANLSDYAMHAPTISLECFMLCEVNFLAGLSVYSDLSFDKSIALLQELDRVINLVISRLPQDYMPLGYFIHRVVRWLRGNRKQTERLTSANKMVDTFESLQLTISSLEERPDDFFMLLARSVVHVCDALEHKFTEKLSHSNDQYHEVTDREVRRHLRRRLLERLRNLFSSIGALSLLLRKTESVIEDRLLRVITPTEFATQRWFDMKQKLSSEHLDTFSIDEKAAYLCLLAKLLWEYRGPKSFQDLQLVFSTVVRECSSMRMKARQSAILQRDRAVIHALSSYISSSFGRETISRRKNKIDTDLITPLNYIWSNTLLVAETMSNPRQQWKASHIDGSHMGPLDLSQRRWSLDLISSVSKMYKRIRADQGDEMGTDALFLNYFEDLSVRYCLMNVFANLEDWERVQRQLVRILQCDDVLRFCRTLRSLPWEIQGVASVPEMSPPPPSHTPEHNSQGIFWPFLGENVFRAAKNVLTGHISGLYATSSEPSLVTRLQESEVKTQDKAAEYDARLKLAASQRQLREPGHLRNKLSRLQSLGIPDSCNCIADPSVDSAIAHFFSLAEKKGKLNEVEASDLRLKIEVVAQLSHESGAKYLGNLEIIYQLAQKLSAQFIGLMDVGDSSDDSDPADESSTGSSGDEEMKEVNDTVEFNTNAGMTQFDWGW